MKRLIALPLSLLLLLFCLIPVLAEATVSFAAQNGSSSRNRSVAVDITAKGDAALGAVTVTLNYNRSVISYRSVKSDDEVTANDSGGSCKVIYLCKNGRQLKNGATLFTVIFRTVASGTSDITYTIAECTDSNAKFINVGACDAGQVEVRGSQARFTPQKAAKTSGKAQSSRSERSKKKNTAPSPERPGSPADPGKYISRDGDRLAAVDMTPSEAKKEFDATLPLLVTGFSAVILALLCFWLGQKFHQYRARKKETKVPEE